MKSSFPGCIMSMNRDTFSSGSYFGPEQLGRLTESEPSIGPQLRELFGPGTPGLHPVLNVCSELRQHIWRAIHPHMHPSGQPGSHSFIRPSMHLFTHPPLHSSTHLPTQPQSFTQLSAHSPIRPLIPASIHPSSTHSSVHPPLYPSIRAFTQTSIHRSINASIHPKAWPQCTIGLGGTREAITILQPLGASETWMFRFF